MSEYQYVAFRAIDAPVSEKNLKFMRQQSSRAEITPLSFENEYHFGVSMEVAKVMFGVVTISISTMRISGFAN